MQTNQSRTQTPKDLFYQAMTLGPYPRANHSRARYQTSRDRPYVPEPAVIVQTTVLNAKPVYPGSLTIKALNPVFLLLPLPPD